MPEEPVAEATTPEATEPETGESDPLDVSAADFYKTPEEASDDPTPEPEGEDGEGDPDDETDEAVGPEADPEDAESEDGDEDGDNVPRLREKIEAVLKETNPELIAEWDTQWKGIEKKEAQLATREAEVTEWTDTIKELYESPELAKEQLAAFLPDLAKHHGTTVEALIGLTAAPKAEDAPTFDDDDLMDSEKALRAQIRAEMKAELDALKKDLQPVKAETEALRQRREQDAVKAENTAYVERVAGRTIKGLEALYPGFKVTKEMIATALETFPQYKADPKKGAKDRSLEAVEACHARAIAVHVGQLAEQKAGKGRERTNNHNAKGKDLPTDPTEWKAADVYRS